MRRKPQKPRRQVRPKRKPRPMLPRRTLTATVHEPVDDSDGLLLSVTLPIELTNRNDGQGKAWYASHTTRQDFEAQIIVMGLRRTPFACKTWCVWTRILGPGQKLWDCSSIFRGNAKQLEDALVACGWWHDDCPKYITEVIGRQETNQREIGPAVRIDIYRS